MSQELTKELLHALTKPGNPNQTEIKQLLKDSKVFLSSEELNFFANYLNIRKNPPERIEIIKIILFFDNSAASILLNNFFQEAIEGIKNSHSNALEESIKLLSLVSDLYLFMMELTPLALESLANALTLVNEYVIAEYLKAISDSEGQALASKLFAHLCKSLWFIHFFDKNYINLCKETVAYISEGKIVKDAPAFIKLTGFFIAENEVPLMQILISKIYDKKIGNYLSTNEKETLIRQLTDLQEACPINDKLLNEALQTLKFLSYPDDQQEIKNLLNHLLSSLRGKEDNLPYVFFSLKNLTQENLDYFKFLVLFFSQPSNLSSSNKIVSTAPQSEKTLFQLLSRSQVTPQKFFHNSHNLNEENFDTNISPQPLESFSIKEVESLIQKNAQNQLDLYLTQHYTSEYQSELEGLMSTTLLNENIFNILVRYAYGNSIDNTK